LGSSDKFDPGLAEGGQFEAEEGCISITIGLAGEILDLVVDAFQEGA